MRNKEGRRFNHALLYKSIFAAMFLGLAIIPPIINHDSTSRVGVDISGGKIECINYELTPYSKKPFDALVIPGGGFTKEKGIYIPGTAERKRLLAGALEYVNGKSDIVILQDGILPEGADPNTTREWFKAYVRVISEFKMEIPDSAFIVDNESINTATGMIELKKIGEKYGFINYLVVDSDSHVNRSVANGCDLDLSMTGESAEELIALIDPNQAMINESGLSPSFFIRFKELTELMSTMYIPGGGATTLFKIASLESRVSGPEYNHYIPLLVFILSLNKINKLHKKSKKNKKVIM